MTISRAHAAAQLTAAGLAPKRAFGQNFVVDPNTVRRIARLANVGPGSHVVEVGPGLGSLTLALAETGAEVVAVEVDPQLVPLLRDNVGHLDNVRVVHADATTVDWDDILGDVRDWVLVANLPYNVATPLVADLLDEEMRIARLFVMIQKEVGERLVARPRTPAYGAVSVKVSFWATASIAGVVPPTVFLPRPKVDSALVSITRRPQPVATDVDPQTLFTLVRAGFAKRRKMLRGALAGIATTEHFDAAGIAPTSRAEELGVEEWIRLCRVVHPQESTS